VSQRSYTPRKSGASRADPSAITAERRRHGADLSAEHCRAPRGAAPQDPAFCAAWERTALARAVALALIDYRVTHHLMQKQVAQRLGVRQSQVSRLEMGEHTPSLEMLQKLARTLGLRFIVDVSPAGAGGPDSPLTLPAGVQVVEGVTSDGSRVLVATGALGETE
jgi:DNA-binding XRE family transcriptional regulator